MVEPSGKRVLLLGSGLMAKPIIEYLVEKGHHVTIASNILEDAQALQAHFPALTTAVRLDIAQERDQATALATDADLVISMVPPPLHQYSLRTCIQAKKSMVTASYVNPDMKALEPELIAAGQFCMNEIGLDPGIDHMTAVKAIEHLKSKGAKIVKFLSSCGCIPAPSAANNPLKYKYSWAPVGATGSVVRPAKYLEEGTVVSVEGKELLSHAQHYQYDIDPPLEFYPNGDSTGYLEKYGLEGTPSVKRATLRYAGYASLMKCVVALGLIDQSERSFPEGYTWRQLLTDLAGPGDEEVTLKIRRKLAHFSEAEIENSIELLSWTDALSELPVGTHRNLLQALVALLQRKLVYQPGERDLTILEHVLTYELGGETRELKSTLAAEGVPSECSSVSKLVGLPVAIAVNWLLYNRPPALGLVLPVFPEFYNPALEELGRHGVHMREEDRLLG